MLPRDEPHPGREMPATGELRTITDGRDDRSRGLRADTPDLSQPTARVARAKDLFDLSVELGDLLVEGEEAGVKLGQYRAEKIAQIRRTILEQISDLSPSPRN